MSVKVENTNDLNDPVVVREGLNAAIIDGLVYDASDYFAVADGATTNILFDPTPLGAGGLVIYRTPVFASTGGPVYVNYYINHDYTGGTPIFTRNRYAGKPEAQSVVTLGATGTDLGTKITGTLLPGGSTNQATTVGSGGTFIPSIFPATTPILMTIENADNVDVEFGYSILWIESPGGEAMA